MDDTNWTAADAELQDARRAVRDTDPGARGEEYATETTQLLLARIAIELGEIRRLLEAR